MVDISRIQKMSGMVGNSDALRQVLEMILQVANVDISVLITGESGTGKDMIARAIHSNSKRSQYPLVIVNSGAIPSGLIESELFGHKKGSFTGAADDRKGYFETANKGTIFLDELGETPLETQVKLLRVLESGEYNRVGDSKSLYTDVRLITATNRNLDEMVRKGDFRQDLFYRLKTVTIHAPALRNRVEDMNLLVERFAIEFTMANDIRYQGFMPDAIRLMKQYEWPGNIRELKNFIESTVVLEKGARITREMVEKHLYKDQPPRVVNTNLPTIVNQSAEQAERELMLRQLFLLRQDTETIKQFLSGRSVPMNTDIPLLDVPGVQEYPDDMKIHENPNYLLRDDAIGDMTLRDIEKEAIERTLKYFSNNRRAAARSLGMSERTLYRKIDDYGLERKIKNIHHDT